MHTVEFPSLRIQPAVLVLVSVLAAVRVSGQAPPPAPQSAPPLTLAAVVSGVAATEAATLNNLMAFRPVIEAYVQRALSDASQNLTASQDTYVLGRFNW